MGNARSSYSTPGTAAIADAPGQRVALVAVARIVLCAALMVLLASTAWTATNPNECLIADTFRDAGLLRPAADAYSAVLTNDAISLADKACAIDALPAVQERMVEAKLALAAFHVRIGNNEAAADSLQEALELDPRSPNVRAALNDLQTKARDDSIARARALAGLGLHDDALEVLTDYLKSEQAVSEGALEAPSDLRYLAGGGFQDWNEFRRKFEVSARTVFEAAALLAIVAILVYLLYLLLRSWFARPVLLVKEFDAGGFSEEHFGKYFSHSLHSRLMHLISGSERGDLQLVAGPIGAIELPSEVKEIIDEPGLSWFTPTALVKAIPALLNWMFPRRVVQVTGFLHKAGRRGVGVTVRIGEQNVILQGHAFWQSDFDDKDHPSHQDTEGIIYQLAEYVAVWLLFDATSRFGKAELNLLGTRDWKSYALFRAGYFAENDNRGLAAKALYQRALRRDPTLRGASVNLAIWHIGHRQDDRAATLLQQVRKEADSRRDSDRDPTLYSASYNLAVLKERSGDVRGAIDAIESLLSTIEKALTKIKRGEKGYTDPQLMQHLLEAKPAAEIMRQGLLIAAGQPGRLEKVVTEADPLGLSLKTQYNLACFYSVSAGESSAKRDEELLSSLKHLELALQLSPRVAEQACVDTCFDTLRRHKGTEFERLIEEYREGGGETPGIVTESPLSKLAIVGERHAEALADSGIVTIDQLLDRTTTASDRRKLAADLTLSPRIVTRWAQAAELTRIVGLGMAEVNLLSVAQVSTIGELAEHNPDSLADDLTTLASSLDDAEAPNSDAVRSWVSQARSNTLAWVS